MTRTILLAGAMMFAAPAFAQTAATPAQTGTAPSQTQAMSAPVPSNSPATAAQQTSPTQAAPAQAAPAQSAATPTTDPAAATQTQVAQVVDQQFATYDKDGDGSLSKAEFSAWMGALKAQSAAAPKETPAQATAWNDAAFKQADGDKSASVTKTELTGFLVRGATQPS